MASSMRPPPVQVSSPGGGGGSSLSPKSPRPPDDDPKFIRLSTPPKPRMVKTKSNLGTDPDFKHGLPKMPPPHVPYRVRKESMARENAEAAARGAEGSSESPHDTVPMMAPHSYPIPPKPRKYNSVSSMQSSQSSVSDMIFGRESHRPLAGVGESPPEGDKEKATRRHRDSNKMEQIFRKKSNKKRKEDLNVTLIKFEVSRWLSKRKAKVEKRQPPPAVRKVLEECFNALDKDGQGTIDADEILKGFKLLGYRVSREYVENLVKVVDQDGTGDIDFTEFIEAMLNGQTQKNVGDEVWEEKARRKNDALDRRNVDSQHAKNKKKKENPYISFDLMAVGLRRKAILEAVYDDRRRLTDPLLKIRDMSEDIDQERHPFMKDMFIPKEKDTTPILGTSGGKLEYMGAKMKDLEPEIDPLAPEPTPEDPAKPKKLSKLMLKKGILLAAQMEKSKVNAHATAMNILKEWPDSEKEMKRKRRDSLHIMFNLAAKQKEQQEAATPARSPRRDSLPGTVTHQITVDEFPTFIHETHHVPHLEFGNLWTMRGVWRDNDSYLVHPDGAPLSPRPPPLEVHKEASICVSPLRRDKTKHARDSQMWRSAERLVEHQLGNLDLIVDGAQKRVDATQRAVLDRKPLTSRGRPVERLVGTEPACLTDRASSRRLELKWGRRAVPPTLPSMVRRYREETGVLRHELKT